MAGEERAGREGDSYDLRCHPHLKKLLVPDTPHVEDEEKGRGQEGQEISTKSMLCPPVFPPSKATCSPGAQLSQITSIN